MMGVKSLWLLVVALLVLFGGSCAKKTPTLNNRTWPRGRQLIALIEVALGLQRPA